MAAPRPSPGPLNRCYLPGARAALTSLWVEEGGVITQVGLQHLLENGPAVSKDKAGQQTPAKPSWVHTLGWEEYRGTTVGRLRPCPHGADREQVLLMKHTR